MAIEIIKEGRPLNQPKKYTYTCVKCGCEFSYTEKDLDWKSTGSVTYDAMDTIIQTIYTGYLDCPWCGNRETPMTKWV